MKRLYQFICFLAILGIGALFLLIVSSLLNPEQWAWYWKLSIVYFVPPAGKETVIPAGLAVGLPPFLWGLGIWIFDILACVAIITNWWIFEFFISLIPAFPFIGIRRKQKPRIYRTKISLKSWYDGLHTKIRSLEAKKYGKLLPFALFIFMFIPFQGTGAMSTTVIGTGLGFRQKETILIVTVGSFLSTIFMILLSLGVLSIF